MLNANGLSFKDLKNVEYAHYPQAGLFALLLGSSEATIVRRAEWEGWDKEHAGVAKVLAVSSAVPGGFSVAAAQEAAGRRPRAGSRTGSRPTPRRAA